MPEYRFRIKMRDGTERVATKRDEKPLPSSRRDLPLELDGRTVWIRITQIWENGDVHAVEIEPP